MFSSTVEVMSSKKTDKVEIRAEPEWVDRVRVAAQSLGLSASGYARMVITQRMDLDGIPKATPKNRKPKGD